MYPVPRRRSFFVWGTISIFFFVMGPSPPKVRRTFGPIFGEKSFLISVHFLSWDQFPFISCLGDNFWSLVVLGAIPAEAKLIRKISIKNVAAAASFFPKVLRTFGKKPCCGSVSGSRTRSFDFANPKRCGSKLFF